MEWRFRQGAHHTTSYNGTSERSLAPTAHERVDSARPHRSLDMSCVPAAHAPGERVAIAGFNKWLDVLGLSATSSFTEVAMLGCINCKTRKRLHWRDEIGSSQGKALPANVGSEYHSCGQHDLF